MKTNVMHMLFCDNQSINIFIGELIYCKMCSIKDFQQFRKKRFGIMLRQITQEPSLTKNVTNKLFTRYLPPSANCMTWVFSDS